MKELNEITTDLEISKQLKESGYPQDSLFYKHSAYDGNGLEKTSTRDILLQHELKEEIWNYWISAPTAEELLNELPKYINNYEWELTISVNNQNEFIVYYSKINDNGDEEKMYCSGYAITMDKDLKNALAKMWIYLKENNLLEENNA